MATASEKSAVLLNSENSGKPSSGSLRGTKPENKNTFSDRTNIFSDKVQKESLGGMPDETSSENPDPKTGKHGLFSEDVETDKEKKLKFFYRYIQENNIVDEFLNLRLDNLFSIDEISINYRRGTRQNKDMHKENKENYKKEKKSIKDAAKERAEKKEAMKKPEKDGKKCERDHEATQAALKNKEKIAGEVLTAGQNQEKKQQTSRVVRSRNGNENA